MRALHAVGLSAADQFPVAGVDDFPPEPPSPGSGAVVQPTSDVAAAAVATLVALINAETPVELRRLFAPRLVVALPDH